MPKLPKLPKLDKLIKTKFTKINNKLDEEHLDILETIDDLYFICKNHWETENKFFKKGIRKLPNNHQNIKRKVDTHIKHHIELLNQIAKLKKTIISHINTEDSDHFHWS